MSISSSLVEPSSLRKNKGCITRRQGCWSAFVSTCCVGLCEKHQISSNCVLLHKCYKVGTKFRGLAFEDSSFFAWIFPPSSCKEDTHKFVSKQVLVHIKGLKFWSQNWEFLLPSAWVVLPPIASDEAKSLLATQLYFYNSSIIRSLTSMSRNIISMHVERPYITFPSTSLKPPAKKKLGLR